MKTNSTPSMFATDPFTGTIRAVTYSPPAQRHSATSVSSARAAKSSAKSQATAAARHFIAAGAAGLTDEELYRAMVESGDVPRGTKEASIRRARVGLVKAQAVRDSGRTRAGSSGRAMAVWTSNTGALG